MKGRKAKQKEQCRQSVFTALQVTAARGRNKQKASAKHFPEEKITLRVKPPHLIAVMAVGRGDSSEEMLLRSLHAKSSF